MARVFGLSIKISAFSGLANVPGIEQRKPFALHSLRVFADPFKRPAATLMRFLHSKLPPDIAVWVICWFCFALHSRLPPARTASQCSPPPNPNCKHFKHPLRVPLKFYTSPVVLLCSPTLLVFLNWLSSLNRP